MPNDDHGAAQITAPPRWHTEPPDLHLDPLPEPQPALHLSCDSRAEAPDEGMDGVEIVDVIGDTDG